MGKRARLRNRPRKIVLDEKSRLAREKWAHLRAVERDDQQPVGVSATSSRSRRLTRLLGNFNYKP